MKDTTQEWKREFEDILPLIVEDYNNFFVEAGEIGELDIEEIVSDRLKPFIIKTLAAQRESDREKVENEKLTEYNRGHEAGNISGRAEHLMHGNCVKCLSGLQEHIISATNT